MYLVLILKLSQSRRISVIRVSRILRQVGEKKELGNPKSLSGAKWNDAGIDIESNYFKLETCLNW